MRSTIVTIFLFLLAGHQNAYSQSGPNFDYQLTISIDGQPVQGALEVAKSSQGKSAQIQDALIAGSIFPIRRGSSFQLSVYITDIQGVKRDITSSKELVYEAFDCLIVSQTGYVTVLPSGSCSGPDFPSLQVFLLDASGKPFTYNQFQFKVVEP